MDPNSDRYIQYIEIVWRDIRGNIPYGASVKNILNTL